MAIQLLRTFFYRIPFLACCLTTLLTGHAYLDEQQLQRKMAEVFQEHCLYPTLTPELVARQLRLLLQQLDPTKSYFTQKQLEPWIEPSPEQLEQLCQEWTEGNFQQIVQIGQLFRQTIERARATALPSVEGPLEPTLLEKQPWPFDEQEQLQRLAKIEQLRRKVIAGLPDEQQPLALHRLKQQRDDFEAPFLTHTEHAVFQAYLHAFAQSLDAHTCYFTPEQAQALYNTIHRKVSGIGVVLSDQLDGYQISRLVEQGPAARCGQLKVGDRIVAVDGEPLLGLRLSRGVLLIQGPKGVKVRLSIQRTSAEGTVSHFEVVLERDEVVLSEDRYRIDQEPFGEGKIATIALYSFYQDQQGGCARDLRRELEALGRDGQLKAVILDLRHNAGGVLSEGVEVCGLFLDPSIVVSVTGADGTLSHLRHTQSTPAWQGPLLVLTNRLSASCSEIVAGTLQDWGRALVVGDPTTFGKGSFQRFTLQGAHPDPYGVFTITQGIYYTVSGRSPQLTGIIPDIIVKGPLADAELGEQTLSYPLPSQRIAPCFEDALEDVGCLQRQWLKYLYLPKLQRSLPRDTALLEQLKSNSARRYHSREKIGGTALAESQGEQLQWQECLNIAKDWLYLTDQKQQAR